MALFNKKEEGKREKKTEVRKRFARTVISKNGIAHEIIRAPWFSEKALIATEKGVYAFAVPASVTKSEIAGAVKEIYNVSPRAVRIVNLPAKRKALRTRRGYGVRARRRKAYVYLNAGDTIQFV